MALPASLSRLALKFSTTASVRMDTLDQGAIIKISTDHIWVSFNDKNLIDYQETNFGIFFSTAGRSRVMLETASIAGGAVAFLLFVFVIGFFVYLKKHGSKKREFEVESQKEVCEKF
jgi:hypothetical protein